MAANDRAGAAASHKPSSAGVISLDDRRARRAELLAQAGVDADESALILQTMDDAERRIEQINESLRKHPSNGRVYDWQGE